MKRILLSLQLALLALFGMAQSFTWGYCPEEVTDNVLNYADGAILLPEPMMQAYAGARIKAIEVNLYTQANNVQACLWPDLNAGTAPVATSSVAKSIAPGWTRIEFNTPYTIDGKALYAGYTTESKYSVGTSGVGIDGSCYVRKAGGAWTDKSSTKGTLTIRVVIEGDNLPADARVQSLDPTPNVVGKPLYINGTFANFAQPLTSYTISYSINGSPARSRTITETVPAATTASFSFPVSSEGLTAGEQTVTAEIVAVNGTPIQYHTADGCREGYINLYDFFYPSHMVVEEITGTWCGYCPRGIVGFEEMSVYPRFIGIAVHSKSGGEDEFAMEDYWQYMINVGCNGHPSAMVNRQGSAINPRGATMHALYERSYEKTSANASVQLKAQWTDDSETTVRLYATSEFGVSESAATYALTFVTLENQLDAMQHNYRDEVWKDKADYVKVKLNHVARGITALKGLPGSIPAEVVSRTPVEYTYDLAIPETVKEVKNIDLVALLLNTSDASIVNACKISYNDIYKAGEVIPEDPEVIIPDDPLTQREDGIAPVLGGAVNGHGHTPAYMLDGTRVGNRSQSHGIYVKDGKKYYMP